MSLTVTYKQRGISPKFAGHDTAGRKIVPMSVAFDDSYPTGGEAISIKHLNVIDNVIIEPVNGYSFIFDYDNEKIKVLYGGGGIIPLAGIQGTITHTQTNFIGPVDNAENTTEDVYWVAPCAGTITAMYAYVKTAPGTGETLTLTIRKNGSNTTNVVAIAGTSTSGNDITHTVTVAAGDRITVSSVETNVSSPAAADLSLSLMFLPGEVASTTDLSGLTDVRVLAEGY